MTPVVQAQAMSAGTSPLPKAEPCVIVILGASGDLTRRKLVPALFRLACAGCTSSDFRVIGVARSQMTDAEFRARMHDGAEESREIGDFTDEEWREFEQRLEYLAGGLDGDETYERIAARLNTLAAGGAGSNRVFYCATPPSLVPGILRGLKGAHLESEERGWSRIVVEKPFGHDLESAQSLNEAIAAVFQEHQVYRIDHYLGKETVRNILVFRFGNSLFEPVWNRNYVDYVEITAAETVGVGTRAGYYEGAGALRDMVANHLLQLVALTAMEPPVAFDANALREQKRQVWQSIRPMTPEEIAERTIRGQYGAGGIDRQRVSGYRDEKGVAGDSTVETYVALELRVDNWRWAGVPFYVRSGKRLSHAVTEIALHLKHTPQALFTRMPDGAAPNVIVMRIQPDEGILVTFEAKLPGTDMRVGTVQMDFCYSRAFGVRTPAAYETLLLDVMRGDQTLFTRRDGIEAQWNIVTPIEDAWAKHTPPAFPNYAAGSAGPADADALLARNGHRWRAPGTSPSC
jgi:glucose-6-phosphate 1-dehydrogenase